MDRSQRLEPIRNHMHTLSPVSGRNKYYQRDSNRISHEGEILIQEDGGGTASLLAKGGMMRSAANLLPVGNHMKNPIIKPQMMMPSFTKRSDKVVSKYAYNKPQK